LDLTTFSSGSPNPDNRHDSVDSSPTAIGKPYALLVLLQVHWFIRLRWVFAAVALGVLATEHFLAPTSRRPWPLLVVILAVAAVNVAWTAISRILRPKLENPGSRQTAVIRSGQLFVGAQIAIDLLLLTWILGLTGGVENPMSLFYLFHMAISGLLLRAWQAALEGLWAVLLYALMCLGQQQGWIPYYPFLPHLPPTGLYTVPHYVAIVVVVNALAVFGTLYFTDRIGKVLNQREEMLIQINAALEQSQRAIQDLQHRRSRFMQTAAHQLKSPLAMVQTFANLIRDGIVLDPEDIQTTCQKIVRRCQDGINQVTELLALARVQDADPRRHRESLCDVGKVVSDLCGRHASVAAGKQIKMSWQIPSDGNLVAHVHEADLADCVGNLIDNAIKYTPSGGCVEIEVVDGARAAGRDDLPRPPSGLVAQRRPEEFVYVVVRDTGMGLDEGVLLEDGTPAVGSVFDPFRRGSSAIAAGIPGTGLGLSIVREVVEQAGGYIRVRSRRGEGSTFAVSFPAVVRDGPTPVLDTRSSEIVLEPPQTQSADGKPAGRATPPSGTE